MNEKKNASCLAAEAAGNGGSAGTSAPSLVRSLRDGSLRGGADHLPGVPALTFRCEQPPRITENTREVQNYVKALTSHASGLPRNLDGLQEVKRIRAALNRQFQQMEDSRKLVKRQVLAPYEQANALYQKRIAEPFQRADAQLKEIVDAVTGEVKGACQEKLERYFEELKTIYGIPWLTFRQTGVTVDLAMARQQTPKKAMQVIREFMDRVTADLSTIEFMDHADEILVEYRKHLNCTKAVQDVCSRHTAMDALSASRQKFLETQEQNAQQENAVREAARAPADTYTARFTVTATMEQLQVLKRCLDGMGIAYTEE